MPSGLSGNVSFSISDRESRGRSSRTRSRDCSQKTIGICNDYSDGRCRSHVEVAKSVLVVNTVAGISKHVHIFAATLEDLAI